MSYSRGAKIKFCTVSTPDDTEQVVLTEQLGPIQFYEDMIDASFHVEIMVFDTAGKLGTTPIRSGSKVFLRIETPSGVIDFEKEPLFISNIKTSGSTAKKEFFVMQLESKGTFINHFSRIYKRYDSKANILVEKFLKEDLEISGDKILEIEEPSNSISFCGNYKRPLQTCVSLATKSIPNIGTKQNITRGGSGFFFWETLKGYNFRSPDGIFKQIIDDKDSIPVYEKVASFNALDPENDFHIVDEPSWSNNDNLLEKLSLGQYAAYNTFFDINARKHVVAEREDDKSAIHEYKPTSQQESGENATTLSNEQPFVPNFKNFTRRSKELPSRYLFSFVDRGTYTNDLTTPQEHVEYEAKRQSRYAALFSQTLMITVPMNVQLSAGSVVKVKFPRINIDRPNSGSNNSASGYYMIKSLSHQLGSQGDFTGLKLVRDAYSKLS